HDDNQSQLAFCAKSHRRPPTDFIHDPIGATLIERVGASKPCRRAGCIDDGKRQVSSQTNRAGGAPMPARRA
ncbi:MAG: hypothetical protein RQ966_14020, partial [Acetobacteraceae bacterium]|nr:hypothetical protein [Acetobacteraceae bacterium]